MYDECQACTVYLTCIIYNSFHSSLGLYIGGLETEKSQENVLWVNSINKVDSWNSNSGFHDYKTFFFFFFYYFCISLVLRNHLLPGSCDSWLRYVWSKRRDAWVLSPKSIYCHLYTFCPSSGPPLSLFSNPWGIPLSWWSSLQVVSLFKPFQYCSLFRGLVMSKSLRLHGLQHVRLPCPSLSPRVCSNSCPLSWWCHPTISSSVTPFSSCHQTFPVSGCFPGSWLFVSCATVLQIQLQHQSF